VRTLRAVIIAVVLLANAIQAIPYAKMEEGDLDDPSYRQGDIEQWHRWLGGVLPVGVEDFGRLVRRSIWASHETLRMLRWPTDRLFKAAHVGQQWGLFAVVTESPDSLVVEVRRDMEWETLYRRLDGDHDWHDDQLKYRRIRGVWDGVKSEPKGTYKRLTVWIARTVFREQADVDRVRVVLEKTVLDYPWVEPDPTVTRRAERYHRRGELDL
jgi:hypothetical protein